MDELLDDLKKLIEFKKKSLESYARRSDASEPAIAFKDKEIAELVRIYNTLEEISEEHFPATAFGLVMIPMIDELMEKDPEIGIIYIQVPVRKGRNGIGYLTFNQLKI